MNLMYSAKHCREQSTECLRLMRLAQSQSEARILRDLSQSWIRIANQTERYLAGCGSHPPRLESVRDKRLVLGGT